MRPTSPGILLCVLFSLPAAAAAGPARGDDNHSSRIVMECMTPGFCNPRTDIDAAGKPEGYRPDFIIANAPEPEKKSTPSPPVYSVKHGCVKTALPPPPCYESSPGRARFRFLMKNGARKFPAEKKLDDFLENPRIITLISNLNDESRARILPPDTIVRTMNVQPGMSVADIGAGTGYLTFPIAQTMRNTGTVFATDIDPRRLASLKEEASRRELSNISPVPVRPDGLDSFYTRQTFDIILICEVSGLLSGKGSSDYFNGLRPSLKQDTGRLFILELTDIPDFDRLVRESLTFWNDHSPVFKRLRPENREYVKNWKHGPLPAERARILIEDFRKIIRDPSFPRDTASYFSDKGNYPFFLFDILNQSDVKLVKSLLARLHKEGVFEKQYRELTAGQKQRLDALNKTLLMYLFRMKPRELLEADTRSRLSLTKENVISLISGCGYEIVGDHGFLPHHYFLEFKRKLY